MLRALVLSLGLSVALAGLPTLLVRMPLMCVGCRALPRALAVAAPVADGAEPSSALADEPEQRIALGVSAWLRDGLAVDEPPELVDAESAAPAVRLPFDQQGRRWALGFETERPATWRLALDWRPGPDGLLIEVQLDGEQLPPARDAWRPEARVLTSDLGPRWLGAGSHLLEFVAREQRDDGAVALVALRLTPP